jgi:hypothetical protein
MLQNGSGTLQAGSDVLALTALKWTTAHVVDSFQVLSKETQPTATPIRLFHLSRFYYRGGTGERRMQIQNACTRYGCRLA